MEKPTHHNGFSLIELVIVVVIIATLAAVAIPRFSRGTRDAAAAALKRDLAAMRVAIELYAAEHDGKYPSTNIVLHLTGFSNITGGIQLPILDPGQKVVFGPYLKEIPPLPVGSKKGATGIFVSSDAGATPPQGIANEGWWYNQTTFTLRANLPDTDVDEDLVPYNTY